jgi:DNA/RNA endonuclease YhcR with UshA esterase domain
MNWMKFTLPVFAIGLFAIHLFADETKSVPLMKISAEDVTNYFNQEMIVTGKVVRVSIRPGIVFVDMDKPYPDSPFTLVIFPSATNQFGNLKALRGASVEVTGIITNYHEHAEIVLKKATQLKVTSPAPTNAPSMNHIE